MRKKFLIMGFTVLILCLAVLLFLIWQPMFKGRKVSEPKVAETTNQQPENGRENQTLGSANTAIEELKGPELKPFFEDEGEKIKETFFERFSALANPSAPSSSIPASTSSLEPSEAATITEIILSLTDEEFHSLYPDVFIASLMEAQNLFIKEYCPDYVPLSKIETDSQVRFVEEKLVTVLLSADMITKEQADIYTNTIRFTLPKLQLQELQNRKSLSLSKFVPANACFFQPSFKRGLFFAGLIEKLYSVFLPKAQATPCGYCYSWPECFQVGVPNPLPGANIWKPFCYCNGCYFGQGCLDFCGWQSAIWDPMTGICGCG
jgi:hypothetical protein